MIDKKCKDHKDNVGKARDWCEAFAWNLDRKKNGCDDCPKKQGGKR